MHSIYGVEVADWPVTGKEANLINNTGRNYLIPLLYFYWFWAVQWRSGIKVILGEGRFC